MNEKNIKLRLRSFASKEKAGILQGFFKTRPGDYGEGDLFLGVVVPHIRRVAKEFRDAPLDEVRKLLVSPYHEERLLALLMLVQAYEAGDEALKQRIFTLYLKSAKYINNWDLVDLSAPNIVGAHLLDRSREPLYTFAKTSDLWKKRIAILATFAFIRQHDYDDTLNLSRMYLKDDHDLIHKAAGWMLREIGKRDPAAEERFLKQHYRSMPRTMLRYAIERFPEKKRRQYLKGTM